MSNPDSKDKPGKSSWSRWLWLQEPGARVQGGSPVPYTRDGIMAQIFVALGQGSGVIRIHQDACLEIQRRYYERITQEVVDLWETEGTQVLERIRAIGRLAAFTTITLGATAIDTLVMRQSARQVENSSGTAWCPEYPPTGEP